MDWIEQIFHVSPDGGNGAIEAIYCTAATLSVAAFVFRRRIRGWFQVQRRREP
jgi:hypothetical protein